MMRKIKRKKTRIEDIKKSFLTSYLKIKGKKII